MSVAKFVPKPAPPVEQKAPEPKAKPARQHSIWLDRLWVLAVFALGWLGGTWNTNQAIEGAIHIGQRASMSAAAIAHAINEVDKAGP